MGRREGQARIAAATLRRGFTEFLWLPTSILGGFGVLAVLSYLADSTRPTWLEPLRTILAARVFSDPKSTADLLRTIAGGIITVTSITISVLLVAVQQTASTMTSVVYDQFLRRRHNEFCFGFFIGLALYALITLATVSPAVNPVFGGTCVLLLATVALVQLPILLYATINQMRSAEIIEMIRGQILNAQERHGRAFRRARRVGSSSPAKATAVHARRHGYVTRIEVDAIDGVLRARAGAEVVVRVPIGSFVAYGDVIAELRASSALDEEAVAEQIRAAIRLDHQRDIDRDPAYGIHELEMIAWTSISTSKSNPAPGLLTIDCLRDLIGRWADSDVDEEPGDSRVIVCERDVFGQLLDTIESLAVASSESMQHQTMGAIVGTVAMLLPRLCPDRRGEGRGPRAPAAAGARRSRRHARARARAHALEPGAGWDRGVRRQRGRSRGDRGAGPDTWKAPFPFDESAGPLSRSAPAAGPAGVSRDLCSAR